MSIEIWAVPLSFTCLVVMFAYIANEAARLVRYSREKRKTLLSFVNGKYPTGQCKRYTSVRRTVTQRSLVGQRLRGGLERCARPAPPGLMLHLAGLERLEGLPGT